MEDQPIVATETLEHVLKPWTSAMHGPGIVADAVMKHFVYLPFYVNIVHLYRYVAL